MAPNNRPPGTSAVPRLGPPDPRRPSLRRRATPGVALALTLLVPGCGGDGPRSAEAVLLRPDSTGIPVRTGPADDRALPFVAAPVDTVGGGSSGELLLEPWAAAPAPDGGFYVVDRISRHVVRITRDGGVAWTAGGEGEGPGELGPVGALASEADGTVRVFDWGRGGVVPFDAGGRHGDPAPSPLWPESSPDVPLLREERPGVRVWGGRKSRSGGSASLLLREEPGGLDTLAVLPAPAEEMVVYERCGVAMARPPLFTPRLPWDAAGGRVAAAPGPGYVVDVFEAGRRVLIVRRELPLRPVTDDHLTAALGEGIQVGTDGGPPCLIPTDEVVEARGAAPFLPWIERVAVAPDGRLWVRRTRPGGTGPVDVFAPDGRYLGSWPAPAPFPDAFLGDGRFVHLEVDPLGVRRAVVYRLVGAG